MGSNENMAALEALNVRWHTLNTRLQAISREIDDKVAAYRQQLLAEVADDREMLMEAMWAVRQEEEKLKAERNAEIVKRTANNDHRVGKIYQMYKANYSFGPVQPQDIYGRGEVLTGAMLSNCKQRGYGFPSIGDVVVRQYKADGTPSKYYYAINHHYWRETALKEMPCRAKT